MDQITQKNKIPVYISLVFSALIIALMALPHSQYNLLSEMNQIGPDASVEWGVVLPAMATIFTILLLVATFLLASVSYLSMKLYNFHFLGICLAILVLLESVAESLYFFLGLGHQSQGTDIIQTSNIIVYILNVAFLISYFVTFFLFIDRPFQQLKKEVDIEMEQEVKEPVQSEKKEEPTPEVVEETKKDETKDMMRKQILQMVAEGKITPEEADKFIKNL